MQILNSCQCLSKGIYRKIKKKGWYYIVIKQSIQIGSMELKNRIIMPPIATYQSTEDGKVTDTMLDYYGQRSKSGSLGMIITEHSYIMTQGKAKARQLSISSDGDIDGLRKLTYTIHQSGTKAMAQLNHAGSAAPHSVTGLNAVSASGIILPTTPMMGDGTVPDELTKKQIVEITECFAKAAARAKKSGYDGIEIHSAHAYLLNQFYSPLTNHRDDEYGGNPDNRLRFLIEVLEAVRKVVGNEFPVSVRLGGCDYTDGGSTIKDSVYAAAMLEKAGVNMISVSGGMCRYTREGRTEPGYFRDMSSAIKEAVSIPVMLTGGVKTMSDAEKLLESGAADLIGVGRELLKNPHWADCMYAV